MIIKECQYQCMGRDPLLNSKHFHNNTIEFIQILTDGGNVLINNKLFPMVYGAVYCIDSEKLHCTLPQNEDNYCRNKIILSKNEFKILLSHLGGDNIPNELVNQGMFILDNKARLTIENLFYDIANKHKADEFNASLTLLKICSILLAKPECNKPSQNSNIEKILQYINSNLEKNITLTDICKSLYISESYLCHTFKKELNMSVKQYIREQQLIKAIFLLENTDDSLEAISQSCGFSSHSQFSKCFKAKMKCSPKAYRMKASPLTI